MFDGDNHIAVEKLTNSDTNKMIRTQKEYEKFGKVRCCHQLFLFLGKYRLMIFTILFLITGLFIANYFIKARNHETYRQVTFYTIYLFGLILCITIAKLLLFCIMQLLQLIIHNSWKVFYIKDIENRLSLALLCILWFLTFWVFGKYYKYDYNDKVFKTVECISISSCVFLFTHILIKAIALNSYFVIFRQRVREIKAYVTFIEIMLDMPPNNSHIFCMPFMNFLIDFPTHNQKSQAQKHNMKNISFKFSSENIDMSNNEIIEILRMSEKIHAPMDDNIENDNINLIHTKISENKQFEIVKYLLDSDLYCIDLGGGTGMAQKINKENLNRLSMLLSYLIIIRLNEVKRTKILSKYNSNKNNNNSNNSGVFLSFDKILKRGRQYSSAQRLSIEQVGNNDNINEECFVRSFKEYPKANKKLLYNLGKLAWKKFRDRDEDMLNAEVLSMNINQIIYSLLSLKQSIDSYIVIIRNLQRMIDVITPILLIFVYLYIFNLDFQRTLTLYVSSVGIIGFFGASYFSSIFASISFIIALNPFLVGDKIYLDNDFYKVREISLISCTFENLRTGWYHTFQNKLLASSKKPIINLSRSKIQRYRWILYFKSNVNNQWLYEFTEKCKKEIENKRDKELNILENYKTHKNNDKIKRSSYCTYAELKTIDFDSIIFKTVKFDQYGRKCVFIEMEYETFSWNVNSFCFNCITSVANMNQYKEQFCNSVPVSIDKEGFAK